MSYSLADAWTVTITASRDSFYTNLSRTDSHTGFGSFSYRFDGNSSSLVTLTNVTVSMATNIDTLRAIYTGTSQVIIDGKHWTYINYQVSEIPIPDKYRYQDSLVNDSNEPYLFELGIFRNGALVETKEYFLESGDSLEVDIIKSYDFEVGIRLTEGKDGWIEQPWTKQSADTVSGSLNETTQWPEINRDPIGYGLTPDFFESVTASSTQQILDAISSSIGNTNARHDALKAFIDYYGKASAKGQTFIINAVNARGDELLAAIESINPADYGSDFLELNGAVGLIQQSVNDLDSALALVSNKADDIKDAVFTVDQTLAQITGSLTGNQIQLLTEIDDVKASIAADDDTALVNAVTGISTAINAQDSTAMTTAVDGISTQIGRIATQLEAPPDIDPNTSILSDIKTTLESTANEPDTANITLGSIDNKTGQGNALLSEIRDKIETGNQQDLDRDSETGTLGRIAETLDPDRLTLDTKFDEFTQPMKDRAQSARTQMQTAISGALPDAPNTARYTGSSSVTSIFPTVTLPILGTIDFDPFKRFSWLISFATLTNDLIKWFSSAAFLLLFYRFMGESFQNVMQTPVQNTSGGGATGVGASVKQAIVSGIVVTLLITALVGWVTLASQPLLPIVSMTSNALNLGSGAPAAVGIGLQLIAVFIPLDHLINLFMLQIAYVYAAIPVATGIQIMLRIVTI